MKEINKEQLKEMITDRFAVLTSLISGISNLPDTTKNKMLKEELNTLEEYCKYIVAEENQVLPENVYIELIRGRNMKGNSLAIIIDKNTKHELILWGEKSENNRLAAQEILQRCTMSKK